MDHHQRDRPFRPLLNGLDLADTVITADALHTQPEHADWLVSVMHARRVRIFRQDP
jgi:predicted transposase YbfD/YdcC